MRDHPVFAADKIVLISTFSNLWKLIPPSRFTPTKNPISNFTQPTFPNVKTSGLKPEGRFAPSCFRRKKKRFPSSQIVASVDPFPEREPTSRPGFYSSPNRGTYRSRGAVEPFWSAVDSKILPRLSRGVKLLWQRAERTRATSFRWGGRGPSRPEWFRDKVDVLFIVYKTIWEVILGIDIWRKLFIKLLLGIY